MFPGEHAENPILIEQKPDIFMAMGNTAEVVARRYQVSREAQDLYALQSQQRYAAAEEKGFIQEEIVPMEVSWSKIVDKQTKETQIVEGIVDRDECNRPDDCIRLDQRCLRLFVFPWFVCRRFCSRRPP